MALRCPSSDFPCVTCLLVFVNYLWSDTAHSEETIGKASECVDIFWGFLTEQMGDSTAPNQEAVRDAAHCQLRMNNTRWQVDSHSSCSTLQWGIRVTSMRCSTVQWSYQLLPDGLKMGGGKRQGVERQLNQRPQSSVKNARGPESRHSACCQSRHISKLTPRRCRRAVSPGYQK